MRNGFYLAVNIISPDDLNDFVAVEQPANRCKEFNAFKSYRFTSTISNGIL